MCLFPLTENLIFINANWISVNANAMFSNIHFHGRKTHEPLFTMEAIFILNNEMNKLNYFELANVYFVNRCSTSDGQHEKL